MGYVASFLVGIILTLLLTLAKNNATKSNLKEYYHQQELKYRDYYNQKETGLLRQLDNEKEQFYKSMAREKELGLRDQEGIIQKTIQEKRSEAIANLEEEIQVRKEQHEKLKIELDEGIKKEKEQAEIQISEIQTGITEGKSKQDAVIETFQNLDELKNQNSHYRITFSDEEKEELYELSKAIKRLRNPLPFRKAVYDIYYKNKINDLVLRIVGKSKVGGIYKITHIESGRTYVGQSVDIGNRGKQHAKRGAGADILTSNKLYPAMLEHGVESFQFEVVEKIEDSSKLSEAEKYGQEHFKSKEFGYSMK